ncbi:10734_t:CDS:2 [Funneliformis geosporum]|nr:10734_t:CDS:2 [Funneliformis geosporum]
MSMQEVHHEDPAPFDKKREKERLNIMIWKARRASFVIMKSTAHLFGIEANCKAFQKTLNLLGVKAKDEGIDEMDVTEPSDDTNISDEDFFLDININQDNIDLLFERAINALKSM